MRKATLFLLPLFLLAAPAWAAEPSDIGRSLPLWSVLPFAGILLSIALFPLFAPHFWHSHYGKVAAFWALVLALPFIAVFRGEAVREILHIYLIDYIPFIILLWALFTISGGLAVTTSLRGTPLTNTGLLLIGTLLASFVGTTGASMVMLRPYLRVNKNRVRKAHLVCFFIFLVGNIGGSLTPLGDPPLFLGFLHQVPFFWVTTGILPHFLLASGILLLIFYLVDQWHYRGIEIHLQTRAEGPENGYLSIQGKRNFIFLGGVVCFILVSGYWHPGFFSVAGIEIAVENMVRDAGIAGMGLASLFWTPKAYRDANEFGWAPILEVAKLFAAIFVTILPALVLLRAGGSGALAGLIRQVESPAQLFWASGGLSSFLDNAPTYLSFFNLILGKVGLSEPDVPAALSCGAAFSPQFSSMLKAISVGAVFMGANTYIGNAPNFMIKTIAEESGVRMPSFFGYMLKYSLPILVPVFLLITILLF